VLNRLLDDEMSSAEKKKGDGNYVDNTQIMPDSDNPK
jgi:hypothetical protein